jgi:hypothetical protein
MGRPEKWAKKKRSQPRFFVLFMWGIGSYILFRLAKSDAIVYNHKYPITIRCHLLDHRWLALHKPASIMAV